jgi:glutamate synthase domain-containing protein 2
MRSIAISSFSHQESASIILVLLIEIKRIPVGDGHATFITHHHLIQPKETEMNPLQPNANEATQTQNRSRSTVPSSGLCTRCLDGCRGNCEVFKATFRGREVIYPGPFGTLTAGADKDYPIDYSHLNILGYALGAKGLPDSVDGNPDTTLFPGVSTETTYGVKNKVKMRLPVFTGALGSTEIARKNWEHFAAGATISGITILCGENVCGIDPKLERNARGARSISTWLRISALGLPTRGEDSHCLRRFATCPQCRA